MIRLSMYETHDLYMLAESTFEPYMVWGSKVLNVLAC